MSKQPNCPACGQRLTSDQAESALKQACSEGSDGTMDSSLRSNTRLMRYLITEGRLTEVSSWGRRVIARWPEARSLEDLMEPVGDNQQEGETNERRT